MRPSSNEMQSDIKIDNHMNVTWFLLRLAGLWNKNKLSHIKANVYKFYSILCQIYILYLTCATFLKIYETRQNLEEAMELISSGIAQVVVACKAYVFVFKRKEVQEIITCVQNNFYIHGRKLSSENLDIINSTLKFARVMSKSYAVTLLLSMFFYFDICPIINSGYKEVVLMSQNSNGTCIRNTVQVYHSVLPANIWFPFDAESSPGFEIAYLYLTIGYHIVGFLAASTDIFCMTMLIYVTGQYELLCDALENMSKNVKLKFKNEMFTELYIVKKESRIPSEENSKRNSHVHIEDQQQHITERNSHPFSLNYTTEENVNADTSKINNIGDGNETMCNDSIVSNFRESRTGYFDPNDHYTKLVEPDWQKEAELYLMDCINHHQRIIEFVEKLDSVWGNVFFVQFLTASVFICFLGFRVITMPIDINLVKLLVFLICIVSQLGMYSIFGSNLMHQSEAVYNAVYESDWYNQSERYKQLTMMMIMRAQKPVRITAGRFGTLSLPLFASLLRSSYSYVALLRQVHGD